MQIFFGNSILRGRGPGITNWGLEGKFVIGSKKPFKTIGFYWSYLIQITLVLSFKNIGSEQFLHCFWCNVCSGNSWSESWNGEFFLKGGLGTSMVKQTELNKGVLSQEHYSWADLIRNTSGYMYLRSFKPPRSAATIISPAWRRNNTSAFIMEPLLTNVTKNPVLSSLA